MGFLSWLAGCSFGEKSVDLRTEDSVPVELASIPAAPQLTARDWLDGTQRQIGHLLPSTGATPLLTSQLVEDQGSPVDVFAHFGMRRESLRTILGNFTGLRLTSQAMSKTCHIDRAPPPWPGFTDVWIPIHDELSLSGRIGFAERDGQIIDAPCIIMQPALFGDNGVLRTRSIAMAMRAYGFHVLSIESRAHGQTEAKYPDSYSTWGILEADDLLVVADWAMNQPHVRETGLIGYCWGANIALLTAWHEARRGDDPLVSEHIKPFFSSDPSPKRRFTAGILAFSPMIRYEEFMDELEIPRSLVDDPVLATIQGMVRDRMVRKQYPNPSGSMRQLIQYEYDRYGVKMPRGTEEGTPIVRLLPYKGRDAGDKMEAARMPVIIVQAADDPVGPAQDVADLISTTTNPNVAAIVLPSGGHVGFAGYAKEWYTSLVLNFFDPHRGAAAMTRGSDALAGAQHAAPAAYGSNRRTPANLEPVTR